MHLAIMVSTYLIGNYGNNNYGNISGNYGIQGVDVLGLLGDVELVSCGERVDEGVVVLPEVVVHLGRHQGSQVTVRKLGVLVQLEITLETLIY